MTDGVIFPGRVSADDRGELAQLHGVGVQKVGDRWFAWGEDKSAGGTFTAVAAYSTADFATWRFEGRALDVDADDEGTGDLAAGRVVERPRALQRPDGAWVLFIHLDSPDYADARVGYALADAPQGPYRYVRGERPLGNESRDIGVFQEDGVGYLLSEDRSAGLRIYRLAPDYLTAESLVATIPQAERSDVGYESPVLVRHHETYYLFGSDLTGWRHNDNMYATAAALGGPWSNWRPLAPEGSRTFESQVTAVAQVNGDEYVYLGDRWIDGALERSGLVALPLTLSGGDAVLRWRNAWLLSSPDSAVVANPVLRGFAPDPSIVRVGDEYAMATSTFEHHPGIRLHRSHDLAHWEGVGHALTENLDLSGVPDSGGIWAPSLSYADGQYWLAYSIVRSMNGDDLDVDNYLVTASALTGPWSAPVFLGSRGFDFSFFHDDDGTHWIVGVQWDQRPEHPSFGGLVVEQYLPDEQRTSGEATVIYQEDGLVEGPNLYRIGDEYHLLIAAGGTGWNHGITVARSRSLFGPYVRDASDAVLTTRDAPGLSLQKAGHGELVRTPSGRWIMAHLAARPVLHEGQRFSTLGRETCLQPVAFDGAGWLRLEHGGHHPAASFVVEGIAREVAPSPVRDDFSASQLDTSRWSTLRVPLTPEVADLHTRPGWLRLHGGHSPASVFAQSMLLQRIQERDAQVEMLLEAEPGTPREAAGLIFWYDAAAWIWLQVTWDEENGRHVRVVRRDGSVTRRSAPVAVAPGPLRLQANLTGAHVRFRIADVDSTVEVPGTFDAWRLSDDHGGRLRFTGLHVGVRADDLDGRDFVADVDWFQLATVGA